MSPRQLVEHEPTDIVAGPLVLAARVAEARRRAGRASRPPRPDGRGAPIPRWCLARRGAALALGRFLALGGTLLALRNLALGQLALFELLALPFGLGLDEPRRHRHRRQHRLLRIVEERDALLDRQVDEAQRVADRHAAHVEVEVLGNLHRQRLDPDLAADLREHAALGDTDRLADELDDDLRLDRLVEPDLLQVDVDQPALHRVLLVVLEDRGVGGLLAFERDVEDRVQPLSAGQHAPQLSLGNADRVRLLAAPVEHGRNQPLLAQAARFGGAAALALLYLQLHSLAGHRRGSLATVRAPAPRATSRPDRRRDRRDANDLLVRARAAASQGFDRVVAMARVELCVFDIGRERLARVSRALDERRDQVRCRRIALHQRDVAEECNRVVVEDPVVLAPDERGDTPGDGIRSSTVWRVEAEQLEIAEQRVVVAELLVDVLLQVRAAARERLVAQPMRRASAVSVSGTVARMIWCWRMRYSGQSSPGAGARRAHRTHARRNNEQAELPPQAGARGVGSSRSVNRGDLGLVRLQALPASIRALPRSSTLSIWAP